MLTLLATLALPMQTAAHTGTTGRTLGDHVRPTVPGESAEPRTPLPEIIQWIRVYKNPKLVERNNLQETIADHRGSPVFSFEKFGIPINAKLSLTEGMNLSWVQFKPTDDPDDPGGLIDTGDNSGRVTATENTAVKVGDRVAIAVRVKELGRFASPDIAIGPLEQRVQVVSADRRESRGGGTTTTTGKHSERKWRLSPNLPMQHYIGSRLTPVSEDFEHTLVYQFVVDEEHANFLNADGPWLKEDFNPYIANLEVADRSKLAWRYDTTAYYTGPTLTADDKRLPPPGNVREIEFKIEGSSNPGDNGVAYTHVVVAYEWLHGQDKAARLTSTTTLRPFNAPYPSWGVDLAYWGVQVGWIEDYGAPVPGWAFHKVEDTPPRGPGPGEQQGRDHAVRTHSHYHVPRYDPADKPHIFYPKIEVADTPATTAIEVPGGTQTGEFTVTLRFSDDGV